MHRHEFNVEFNSRTDLWVKVLHKTFLCFLTIVQKTVECNHNKKAMCFYEFLGATSQPANYFYRVLPESIEPSHPVKSTRVPFTYFKFLQFPTISFFLEISRPGKYVVKEASSLESIGG
jgi:hypothetical protein